MFPGCLAEGPFSLRTNERGAALSLSAELSPEGEILSHSVLASHVMPTEKMTYDELDQAIASESSEKLSESLQILLEVRLPLWVCRRTFTDLC
jgi:exoribonuclease R